MTISAETTIACVDEAAGRPAASSEAFRVGPVGAPTDTVLFDRETLKFLTSRLSLDDVGRLSVQLARAAASQRPSELQRLLLAILLHREREARHESV